MEFRKTLVIFLKTVNADSDMQVNYLIVVRFYLVAYLKNFNNQ